LDLFEATFDAMLKLIEWLLYALPLGLFTLLAPQVAEAGVGVFIAMLKLIVLVNVAVLATLLIGNFIIARRTNTPYFRVLSALGESLLIAFATKSSFAAIPSTLQALQTRLHMDKHTTDLVIPLSISLNPIGNVHYYTLGAIFIAQLYNVPLTATSLVILLMGGMMAAVAGSALPSAAAIGVFAIILEPLGLPVGSAVILIMAIDSFIDPATTVLNIHGSCVAASLVADRPAEEPAPPSPVAAASVAS
jgi:proton glutamate symport protein